MLAVCILPALGTLTLRDIGKADDAPLHGWTHTSPVAANRALALLSPIVGWADLTLQWERIDMEAGTARVPASKTGATTLYLPCPFP